GFPGTIASTWHQAGRAGRGREGSLAVLVALPDPVNQFFCRHPERLFGAPAEHALIDPDNIYIRGGHLLCAAYELPLTGADKTWFGEAMDDLLSIFADEGLLTQRRGQWYWAGTSYPAAQISLRSASGDAYQLLDRSRGGELIGTMEVARAFETVHEGAIYLHAGESYRVVALDPARREVHLEPVEVDYYTLPSIVTEVEVETVTATCTVGQLTAGLGEVTVTRQVIGYREIKQVTEQVLAFHPLDLPPRTFETTALWLSLPLSLAEQLSRRGYHLLGSVHAVEHALVAVLPLFAMCDRLDVEGASTHAHRALRGPAIFVYDAFPGGVGIAEKGYDLLPEVLRATYDTLLQCDCEAGCPSCVQSPFCGNNNEPLDKEGAVAILRNAEVPT
ncbi:MAG TPA: DUF1998 domain-containing protein, partial [Armatimonadetes bacterium]|nr:DUF1998 domain-containing protein [Armatimonadota bacterium]